MSRRRSLLLRRAILLLSPLVAVSCGDETPRNGGAASQEPPPTRLEVEPLSEDDLAGLEPERVVFNLSWSGRVVVRAPESAAARATLLDVRLEPMEGFDRAVLQFGTDAPFPGYRVAWADSSETECGTALQAGGASGGRPLIVRLRPAQARTDAGTSTIRQTDRRTRFTGVKRARQLCDEGGLVEWLLDVADSADVRVLEMREPPRLVVDVRHPAAVGGSDSPAGEQP